MHPATPTSIYSDSEIKAALRAGHIICDPAPTHINGSSVDVTLGYYFYHAGGNEQDDELFNPFDQADVERYFGEYKIAKHGTVCATILRASRLLSSRRLPTSQTTIQ